MPSQKPRIALTLSNELRDALTDLGTVIGKPVATVAVDLLTEMIPQIVGITKVARASKAGNTAAAKRALVHMVGDNMAEMMVRTQGDMFPKKKGAK